MKKLWWAGFAAIFLPVCQDAEDNATDRKPDEIGCDHPFLDPRPVAHEVPLRRKAVIPLLCGD